MTIKYKTKGESDWKGIDVQELAIFFLSTFYCTPPFNYLNYIALNWSFFQISRFPRFWNTCLEGENVCIHPGVWPQWWQISNTLGVVWVSSVHILFTCILIYVVLARGKKIRVFKKVCISKFLKRHVDILCFLWNGSHSSHFWKDKGYLNIIPEY